MGSNSVRLLVADVSDAAVEPVLQRRETTRLLAGIENHRLHPDAIARTAQAIARFCRAAREAGAQKIVAFGTSAMRDGHENSRLLIEAARECGAELRVLSGEEEALWGYAGCAPRGRALALDIGGGSTELLRGADGRVLFATSAQMGAVRLCEAMNGRADQEEMVSRARAALAEGARAALNGPFDRCVGSGGSITSLAAMQMGLSRYDAGRVQDYPLGASAAYDWLARLCALDLAQRRALPGLNPERADIIPFGCAILVSFFDLTGITQLFVSDRDNLYGALRALWAEGGARP